MHPARTDAVKPAPPATPPPPVAAANAPAAGGPFAPTRTVAPEPLRRASTPDRAGAAERASPPKSIVRRLAGCVFLLGALGCGGGVLGGGAIGVWSIVDPNGFNNVVDQINDAVRPYLGGGSSPSKQPASPTPRRRTR